MKMSKHNVIFCDENSSLALTAHKFFNEDEDIKLTLCNTYTDFARIYISNIDVVVLDIDFERAKDIIRNVNYPAQIILTSAKMREDFPCYLSEFNFAYCFFKPYSFVDLRERILGIMQKSTNIKINQNYNIDEKLSNIFIRAGIPPHIKGYQFLREAVKLSIGQPDMINSITKKLYPTVANNFNTSASKVERAIRHAIEVAWSRGKIENINAIFGIKIYSKGEKPTNGELIALVADKLIIESNNS